MTAKARLDEDRTAKPMSRIIHHPAFNQTIVDPGMPLYSPEYENNGERQPLINEADSGAAIEPVAQQKAYDKVLAAYDKMHQALRVYDAAKLMAETARAEYYKLIGYSEDCEL